MSNQPMMIKADGNLVLMHAEANRERAYALFRVHMPASDELLFMVRLYNSKTEGGIHLPSGGKVSQGGTTNVRTEIFDRPLDAMKRCEEWNNPVVEVPEMVMQ
jgi:hypothetical protein